MKRLFCGMLRSNTLYNEDCPHSQPGSLYIPRDTKERHFSSVTFKNIGSEEFLIVYPCLSCSPHSCPFLLYHHQSCPPLVPFMLNNNTHANPHAWALIRLVHSVQGQEGALMKKLLQLISEGLEM